MQTQVAEHMQDRQKALTHILDAWEVGELDGIPPELMAYASLFAGLSELVAAYGEEAVSDLAAGLPGRVLAGEFTLKRRQ